LRPFLAELEAELPELFSEFGFEVVRATVALELPYLKRLPPPRGGPKLPHAAF
jgi:hypothetical protein